MNDRTTDMIYTDSDKKELDMDDKKNLLFRELTDEEIQFVAGGDMASSNVMIQ